MANRGTRGTRDDTRSFSYNSPDIEPESFYGELIFPETDEPANLNEATSVPMNAEVIENQVSGRRKADQVQLSSTSKPELKVLPRKLADKGNMMDNQTNYPKAPEQIALRAVTWKGKVEEVQLFGTSKPELEEPCSTLADKGSDPETVEDIKKCCPEAQEVTTTACWSLIKFQLPEFPLQRKTIPIREMIREVDEMQKYFKLLENIPDMDNIITVFEILYILEINSCITKSCSASLSQIEEVCKIFRSTESVGIEIKSRNLHSALKYVRELAQSEAKQKYHGLIDVDCFILEMHRRILGPGNQGGEFSTNDRFGVVDQHTDELHKYPKFESIEHARSTVQLVADHYNAFLDEIKLSYVYNEDSKDATENLFKISGMLLFKITYYHPFGDGNGRLARLLSSYALSLISPFPTPTYGLFSPSTREEYVDALIEARENNSIPGTLTALIIESSYFTWKTFYEVVRMAKMQEQTWKELLLSCASLAKILEARSE